MNRIFRVSVLTAAAFASLSLAACANRNKAAAQQVALPDEFRVITSPPLFIPPDYGLRPPSPGEPRPAELRPENVARSALLGALPARNVSQGESLLMAKAGVSDANANIKFIIDDEYGDLTHKQKSFSERVLFWRKDRTDAQVLTEPGASAPSAIDPAAEQRRLAELTGGQPITISRTAPEREDRKFKLPGL